MNRIILIGNGFDLAHGIPTDYKSFIDFYWNKAIKEAKSKGSNKIENQDFSLNFEIAPDVSTYKELKSYGLKIEFHNLLLERIMNSSNAQNWVDIENEFYTLVKELANKILVKGPNRPKGLFNYSILKLNSDLDRIKNTLTSYLKQEEKKFLEINEFSIERFRPVIKDVFSSRIYLRDLYLEKFEEEILKEKTRLTKLERNLKSNKVKIHEIPKHDFELIKAKEKGEAHFEKQIKKNQNIDGKGFYPNELLILSFNYTSTELMYEKMVQEGLAQSDEDFSINRIHIHGELENSENPIIFGFGDELGSEYRDIENLNDNNFLENMKSIKYLETDNHRRLEDFINKDDFQVLILGHSCGISDRTLLNTIFENKRCVSIKPYYHRIDSNHDNYSEITRNISRCFNSKSLMRKKVVNKTYCESLN